MQSISCYERRTVTLMCPHCYNVSVTDYNVNFRYTHKHKLHADFGVAQKGKFKNGLNDDAVACDKCKDAEPIILDPRIAFTIMILNKKGFKTTFSCAGHKWPPDETDVPYISFEDSVPIDIFKNLPEGWRLDVDGDFIAVVKDMYPAIPYFPVNIYYYPAEIGESLRFDIDELDAWASNLPSMKEYEGEHSENTTQE